MPDLSALPAMVECSGGMFRMGTPDDHLDDLQRIYQIRHRDMFEPEVPQHDVELAPFTIDMYPVTNAQFHTFLLDQPANSRNLQAARAFSSNIEACVAEIVA